MGQVLTWTVQLLLALTWFYVPMTGDLPTTKNEANRESAQLVTEASLGLQDP